MKIETIPQEDHQIKLVVEVESEQLTAFKRRAARRLAERAKIPGFRPGKAPYDIILRHVGESTVTEEAVELLVDEIYPQVIKESDIKPAAPGSLEKVESLDPPKFTFLVPLEPVVDLGDYRALRMTYDWQVPGEDKLNESVEDLRRMHSSTETVERPIKLGDFVLVDVKGVPAKAVESETPLIDRPGFPVFIRTEEKIDEWPFSGFSRQLVGLQAGENKNLTHKYSKEFNVDDLAGKLVKFEVAVKTVRAVILPELNDEFAKTIGSFENLQALRDVVRANLEQQSKSEYDNDYYSRIIEEIKKNASIKYPPQILQQEIEQILKELESRLANQGLDMEAYIKSRQMEREKFIEDEVKPSAVKQLERSLIMDEIAHKEKIKVSEEALTTTFNQTWSALQSDQGFQKVTRGKTPSKNLVDMVAMESLGRAITQQTLDRLKEIATGHAPELPEDEITGEPVIKKSAGRKTSSAKKSVSTKTAISSKKSAVSKKTTAKKKA